jgi:hypothetical protein
MLEWLKKLPVRKKDASIECKTPTREEMDLGVFADRNEPTFSDSLREIVSRLED